jgi:ATP-dependent DNA helicase RecQ
LRKLLQSIFRKGDFRNGQLPILNRALTNRSVIGLLPTGAGKSLTYQLAAMLQPGITIVIDPIRSLMLDQYKGLKEIYIDNCAYINSTLSVTERTYVQQLLTKGQLQLIFVSPERFVIEGFRNILDVTRKSGYFFSYAVIDEVHCVSEWGHDFRTPYLNLGTNLQTHCITFNENKIPLIGLTATASFDVLADIERELHIPDDDGKAVVRHENTIRDEINYQIVEIKNQRQLDEIKDKMTAKSTIGKLKQEAVLEIIENKETLFNKFNNHDILRTILSDSYKEYVRPGAQRAVDGDMEQFIIESLRKLHIDNSPFSRSEEETRYKYGIIVFSPHRSGWLGIRSGTSAVGMFDHGTAAITKETLGYFMGSGDDENADVIDKESFKHLDEFKSNVSSVMVATKAFGMGIDKPDVRMTIHLNIPQSIESFVQEAGRAGRDGKVAVSTILFNNDILQVSDNNDTPFHLDRDVLLYFHNNSFKGKLKERVIIYELRNKITFPNRTNREVLTEQMNELFGDESLRFSIVQGQNNHYNRIFVNLEDRTGIGAVDLISQELITYNNFGKDGLGYELLNWLKNRLPFNNLNGGAAFADWLNQIIVNANVHAGIEKVLSEMILDEERLLNVPFTNLYYSRKTKSRREFILSPHHAHEWMSTRAMQKIVRDGRYEACICKALLRDAVYDKLDYITMVRKLDLTDKVHEASLLDIGHPDAVELQKAYYIPRSQDDTAKAIYRLTSIEIIESYTIDYQNKIYTLHIKKKKDEVYYNSLQNLIARYASSNVAASEIQQLKADAVKDISLGKATVISKCLEYLTDFIYEKIKEKRLQAIDDMVQLCQHTIGLNDTMLQNKFIKDEIYYYFNAKYSKRDLKEQKRDGKEVNASMLYNRDIGLAVYNFIELYIDLVENEANGQFINNIKHLRGSCMRMLRSYPGTPEFKILKAFSLFILGMTIFELLDEAKTEFVEGLLNWNESEQKSIPVGEFLSDYKMRLIRHMDTDIVESLFEEVEDRYYTAYYANYTRVFNNEFLAQ